jgi:hypothetical protein
MNKDLDVQYDHPVASGIIFAQREALLGDRACWPE